MDPSNYELLQRVERLERIVDELRSSHAARPAPTPSAPPPLFEPVPQPSVVPTLTGGGAAKPDLRSWLRFIGIALLLFGVIFLFKFSDNESANLRAMRVGIGVALGTGLVVVGRLLLARDRAFAQVLTGGGIGVWYISGFAAYQLFALIAVLPAFAYMTVVTMIAFVISVRQNSQALAIVATVGGLATPSLLHDRERGVIGVVLYVALVATGAVAMHARRKWSSLLWVTAVASGIAMLATQFQYYSNVTQRWYLQSGTIYLYAMFAVFAVMSYIRQATERERPNDGDDRLLLALSAPVYLVITTALLWNLGDSDVGWLCLATAAVYALATARFFPVLAWGRLTSVHLVVASGMTAAGILSLLHGDAQHAAVATQALALRFLFRRTRLQAVSNVSHALFVIVAALVLRDLTSVTRPAFPLADRAGIFMLWSILATAGAAYVMPRTSARRFYLYAVHAGVLGWIYHQFSLMRNGQAIVSVVWGLYGAGLLVAGLLRSIRRMRTVGLLTLLAVVAKLFMVDLQSVPAIWRILLFIGFGGGFLALSYWFMSLDRSRVEAEKVRDAQ